MMEQTKMIEKVRENVRQYDGRNGTTHIHMVTIEGDQDEWEYHSLKDVCDKFVPKTEAVFTTEVSVNGKYTNRKIKPIKLEKGFKEYAKSSNKKNNDAFRDPAVLMYNEVLKAVTTGLQGSSVILDKTKVAEYVEYFYEEAKKKKGDAV
jgi:predicted nucleotidyltransferase